MTVMIAAALAAATAAAQQCPDVLDYRSWREQPSQQWDFRAHRLTIIGAEHSRDPSHPQFARISASFAAAKPTIAFFEGPDRGTRDGAGSAIMETGESGYLRMLAREAAIPALSLEPSPPEQIKTLMAQFPADQVILFFVVRESTRLRDRELLQGEKLEAAVAKLLEKVAPMEPALGAPLPFKDIAGLDRAFRRYWPGRDWKTADAAWFSPTADDAATGGIFAAAINRADSSNRNRHMVKLFAAAAAEGQRPFVIVGRNHVPMISPALECVLKVKGAG